MVKNILVLGAISQIVQQVIFEALDNAFNITVMLSESEKLSLLHNNLEIIKGDVKNYYDVKSAAAGQDAIIWAFENEKAALITTGTHNMLLAMEEMRVQKVICLSSIGAGSTAGRTSWWFDFTRLFTKINDIYEAKGEQEKMIVESGLSYTIVQIGNYVDDCSRQPIKIFKPEQVKKSLFTSPSVCRKSAAQFVISQISLHHFDGKTVCLCS
jgi:putative NADH-flavin reductase